MHFRSAGDTRYIAFIRNEIFEEVQISADWIRENKARTSKQDWRLLALHIRNVQPMVSRHDTATTCGVHSLSCSFSLS
ncbi:unnamed protein product [Cylicocyclus nassatus]|uniref:Uncharacterized protein n=1 Tax=Cylicocyclus nassatus TaxID=53992 RepID=A0AA36MDN2_CYLNA|nr:unnamed protein product [Cylicocyclus nassatus]